MQEVFVLKICNLAHWGSNLLGGLLLKAPVLVKTPNTLCSSSYSSASAFLTTPTTYLTKLWESSQTLCQTSTATRPRLQVFIW